MKTIIWGLLTVMLYTVTEVTPVSAYATVEIWNNTGKTILDGGDQIQVLISFTKDENYHEIAFRSTSQTYFTAGVVSAGPLVVNSLSDRPDRKEVLITFTLPADFAANDSVFYFAARMYNHSTGYHSAKSKNLSVRAPPVVIAPVSGGKATAGVVSLEWSSTVGAEVYQLELSRVVSNIKDKVRPVGLELLLDSVITEPAAAVTLAEGSYSWRIRPHINGEWKAWSPPSQFTAESPLSVDLPMEASVKIYPNPAAQRVWIEVPHGLRNELQLIATTGQVVLCSVIGEAGFIDVTSYPAGAYLLRVVSGSRVSTTRVVLQ